MCFKLVLADDHQLLLQGISSVVREINDVQIVATAGNGIELMELVKQHQPHLVLLDLNMPGYDGLKCIEKLKREHSSIKVLVLTSYNQPELVEEVRKLGADGFLVKNSTSLELKEAIVTVLSGGSLFPLAHDLQDVQEDSYFFDDFLKKYQLTKREVDIIRLICQEMSSKQIAASLFLSEFTINTHRKNILRKLEVKNVAGLINFAKQNHLV